jgi:cytidyltransferase-like protein
MARIGLYTGSFDPLTNGHLDVIHAASAFCDRIIVGIGTHPGKAPVFSPIERVAMVRAAMEPALVCGQTEHQRAQRAGCLCIHTNTAPAAAHTWPGRPRRRRREGRVLRRGGTLLVSGAGGVECGSPGARCPWPRVPRARRPSCVWGGGRARGTAGGGGAARRGWARHGAAARWGSAGVQAGAETAVQRRPGARRHGALAAGPPRFSPRLETPSGKTSGVMASKDAFLFGGERARSSVWQRVQPPAQEVPRSCTSPAPAHVRQARVLGRGRESY